MIVMLVCAIFMLNQQLILMSCQRLRHKIGTHGDLKMSKTGVNHMAVPYPNFKYGVLPPPPGTGGAVYTI